jgi:hypothetical protein
MFDNGVLREVYVKKGATVMTQKTLEVPSVCVYIYIYMCVCVCVRACVRAYERIVPYVRKEEDVILRLWR